MAFLDWFENFPPMGLDNGLKLLIYLLIIYTLLSALIVFLLTRKIKQTAVPSLLGIDTGDDEPISTDIPPAERIAILNIEKAKNVAAQKTLSDVHRRKEVSDTIFNRLSVRYATEVQKMEEEIEKTAREVEVSQLEQELKKMQGDYLTKIKGDESKDTPAPAPPTPGTAPAPPAPPTPGTAPAPPRTAPAPPGKAAPTAAPPVPQGIPAPAAIVPKAPVTAQTAPSEEEGDLFAKSTSIAALRKEMLKELDRLKKFMSDQQ